MIIAIFDKREASVQFGAVVLVMTSVKVVRRGAPLRGGAQRRRGPGMAAGLWGCLYQNTPCELRILYKESDDGKID